MLEGVRYGTYDERAEIGRFDPQWPFHNNNNNNTHTPNALYNARKTDSELGLGDSYRMAGE